MSHSTVLVLLKDKDPTMVVGDDDEDLVAALAPFDENLKVDAYKTECACVGRDAEDDARMAAIAAHGSWDEFRAAFWEGIKKDGIPEDEKVAIHAAWKKAVELRNATERAALDAHPMKGKPDPGCGDCRGSGTVKSTYNPKSRWDWYAVGGRWCGDLGGGNQIITKDLVARVKGGEGIGTFAILTPDGEWFEQGKMGWWATVTDEKKPEDWKAEWLSILERFPDTLAVLVDVHI